MRKTGDKVYEESVCPAALADFVDCQWSLRPGKDEITVYPDGYADLVLDESGFVHLVGIRDQTVRRKTSPQSRLLGLRLKSGTLTRWFGASASEFLNRTVHIGDVPSPLAKELAGMAKRSDRQEQLWSAAVSLLAKASRTESRLCWLEPTLSRIQTQSVRSVAESMHISERHLHRLFLQAVGIGPAKFKRILRFQQTIDAMRRSEATLSMADLAMAMGFSDQAHMHHEVKAITAKTPSELLAEVLSD